jgi:hypothetical protein
MKLPTRGIAGNSPSHPRRVHALPQSVQNKVQRLGREVAALVLREVRAQVHDTMISLSHLEFPLFIIYDQCEVANNTGFVGDTGSGVGSQTCLFLLFLLRSSVSPIDGFFS